MFVFRQVVSLRVACVMKTKLTVVYTIDFEVHKTVIKFKDMSNEKQQSCLTVATLWLFMHSSYSRQDYIRSLSIELKYVRSIYISN